MVAVRQLELPISGFCLHSFFPRAKPNCVTSATGKPVTPAVNLTLRSVAQNAEYASATTAT